MENYKLPERLVTVLKTAHVTQKQLGDMLGIDRTAVVKYCNGERIPSSLQFPAMTRKICGGFCVRSSML